VIRKLSALWSKKQLANSNLASFTKRQDTLPFLFDFSCGAQSTSPIEKSRQFGGSSLLVIEN
jgi:hypothetical protein